MSRTTRKSKYYATQWLQTFEKIPHPDSIPDGKSVQEHQYGKRMKPYAKTKGKFAVDLGQKTGVSKLGKLVARNANRGLKKAVRQQSKRLIEEEIQQQRYT